MNIVIAGTRTFMNYQLVVDTLNNYINNQQLPRAAITIVCGGAPGADFLGAKYATEFSFQLKVFPAYWNLYGKKAGPLRNAEMAKVADLAFIFWDGKSKGTLNMINQMRKLNKPVEIINY